MITLRIALNNLLASRRRTIFLGAALFLVTMFFVMMLALTGGVLDNLIRASTSISSGHLNIGGYYKSTPSDSQTIILNTSQLKQEAKEALPDAVRIVDRLRGWGKIISDQGTVQTGLNGIAIDEEREALALLELAPAKEYLENAPDPERIKGSLDELKKPGTIVIFASAAKRLKVDVGDAVTLRTETLKGQSNTAEATVAAVVRDLGLLSSWASFVPKQTVVELYQLKPDVSGAVQIWLKDIDRSEEAMNELRAHLDKKGYAQIEHDGQPFFIKLLQTVPNEDWTGAKLDVTTWEDEASFLTQIITGLRAVSFFLVLLLAVVIVIGITNTMTIAVRERTREIGTLRAIGMQRWRVLALFMIEATLLGIFAAGAGGVVGALASLLLDAAGIQLDIDAIRVVLLSDKLHLVPRLVDVVAAVLTLTAVSALAAFLPSLRAARITPVTAMQSAE
ncbi:MAG: ABC transporter permease [Deltaproteobacteria bacterium]|nr:ABC transporter permease [Deltaproteobacteria bacterium]